jgi:hypothetical protein
MVSAPSFRLNAALVVAVAVGRVGQGAHYTHDVLAGLGVGVGWVAAIVLVSAPATEGLLVRVDGCRRGRLASPGCRATDRSDGPGQPGTFVRSARTQGASSMRRISSTWTGILRRFLSALGILGSAAPKAFLPVLSPLRSPRAVSKTTGHGRRSTAVRKLFRAASTPRPPWAGDGWG